MTKTILKLLHTTTILVVLTAVFNIGQAQDDMMDEGYDEAPTMEHAEEIPPTETFEDAPSYDELAEPAYEDAGPGTPTEAIKDFNNSQDERMEQLDSYEEDY